MWFFKIEGIFQELLDKRICYTFEDLVNITTYLYNTGWTFYEIENFLDEWEFDFNTERSKEECIQLSIKIAPNIPILRGSFGDNTVLYESEIIFLQNVQNPWIRKFLYILLIVAKWNNHPTGWTRFDKREVFYFWCQRDYNKNTFSYKIPGFEQRVIGSKNPIVCYNLSFRSHEGKIIKKFDEDTSSKDIKDFYYEVLEKRNE